MTDIRLQYNGFNSTPQLWDGEIVGLSQINIQEESSNKFDKLNNLPKLRLGHLVERFVANELNNNADIEILAENIQIKKDKRTIGEIDCLLTHNHTPVHLEIIYKFYIYDESVGSSELEHWIGPNRKDSLIEKITKLKTKQLPLLYKQETASLLTELKLDISKIQQQVYFKAQLFVPFKMRGFPLRLVNNNCIQGYYIRYNDIEQLYNHKLYIPTKLDWLTNVHDDVTWLNYKEGNKVIKESIIQERSPLCWIKDENNNLQKVFIVWW
jgi:hypothetical protein